MPAERRAQFRVRNVLRSRISELAPFRIYEHAQCRVFQRTCLQRTYVIPCRHQMGSSAVLRARRSALVLAAKHRRVHSIGRECRVSRPYLRYGDRDIFQNVSPPSVLFESSRIFYNTQATQTQKMMDQNFDFEFRDF